MKKTLTIIFFTCFIITANAQNHKAFLDKKGAQIDSANATSYIIYGKFSDTSWVMKLYSMNNAIVQMGTYKDQNLSISNGKFIYYKDFSKDKKKGNTIVDTLTRVLTEGYFVNNIKTGPWVVYEYFPNGNIQFVKTYQNNVLNGEYKSYNYDFNTILIKGNYIDGKKEGEWDTYDTHGNIILIENYNAGAVVQRNSTNSVIQGAVPPDGFNNAIIDNIKSLINDSLNGSVVFEVTITTEGKLINPHLFMGGISHKIDKQLLDVITASPVWHPTYNTDVNQNIQDDSWIIISIKNGLSDVKFVNADPMKSRIYQLSH